MCLQHCQAVHAISAFPVREKRIGPCTEHCQKDCAKPSTCALNCITSAQTCVLERLLRRDYLSVLRGCKLLSTALGSKAAVLEGFDFAGTCCSMLQSALSLSSLCACMHASVFPDCAVNACAGNQAKGKCVVVSSSQIIS